MIFSLEVLVTRKCAEDKCEGGYENHTKGGPRKHLQLGLIVSLASFDVITARFDDHENTS